jgi:hypothetical protein
MNPRNLEGDARVAHADAHPTARCERCDQYAVLIVHGGEEMCEPCAEWAGEVEAAPEPVVHVSEDAVERWLAEGARVHDAVIVEIDREAARDDEVHAEHSANGPYACGKCFAMREAKFIRDARAKMEKAS